MKIKGTETTVVDVMMDVEPQAALEALRQELIRRAKRDGADISPNGDMRSCASGLAWEIVHSWPATVGSVVTACDLCIGKAYGPLFDAVRKLEDGMRSTAAPLVRGEEGRP
jgi:hypothetical protein